MAAFEDISAGSGTQMFSKIIIVATRHTTLAFCFWSLRCRTVKKVSLLRGTTTSTFFSFFFLVPLFFFFSRGQSENYGPVSLDPLRRHGLTHFAASLRRRRPKSQHEDDDDDDGERKGKKRAKGEMTSRFAGLFPPPFTFHAETRFAKTGQGEKGEGGGGGGRKEGKRFGSWARAKEACRLLFFLSAP